MRRRPFHPWHLVRCHHCHKMLLNSAPKCPHCSTWQRGARLFSLGFGASVSTIVALSLYLAVSSGWHHLQQQKLERNRLLATTPETGNVIAVELRPE